MRLKNAPGTQPYVIEQLTDLTSAQAGELSVSWWESRGTLAMVLMADGAEDSRYERDYLVAERVPGTWPKGKKPPMVAPSPTKAEALEPQPPRPRAPPTVANLAGAAKRKCPTCGRGTAVSTEAKDGGSGCPTCGAPFSCGSCLRVLPASRHYEGDDDPTPSGRLANLRCPECGAAQHEMTAGAIWKQYTRR
jgi:ribosomal protein L37AE/L43A